MSRFQDKLRSQKATGGGGGGRPTVTMQLTGLKDIKKAVRELKKAAVSPELITAALKPAAVIVKKEAKRIVQYDEKRTEKFHLRDSIFVMSKPTARHPFSVAVAVSYDRAPHAHLVEFGTKGHVIKAPGKRGKARVLSDGSTVYGTAMRHPGTRKRPFMRPAWRRKRKDVFRVSGRELGKLFEKTGRKLNVGPLK